MFYSRRFSDNQWHMDRDDTPLPPSAPPASTAHPARIANPLTPEQYTQLLVVHRVALTLRNGREEQAHPPVNHAPLAACPLPDETAPPLRVYFDVTKQFAESRNTPVPEYKSIDRVVINLLAALRQLPIDLVPTAFDGTQWRELHFTTADDPISALRLGTSVIAPGSGDHFLICEFKYRLPAAGFKALAEFRRRGVTVNAVIHDLFMLTHPEWFNARDILSFRHWLRQLRSVSDHWLCISQHTAEEVRDWFAVQSGHVVPAATTPPLSVFPLGSDSFAATRAHLHWPARPDRQAFALAASAQPSFLCIAAIHPRKGIASLLDAFETLWREQHDVRLVLVGRAIDAALTARLKAHPEAGKHLHFTGFLGDGDIIAAARHCEALIVPSHDEGYGLPLLESVALDLPVIARDIAVFREIAGDAPFYFGNGNTLGTRLKLWLTLSTDEKRRHMPRQTLCDWTTSATQLLAILRSGLRLPTNL